MTTDDVTKTRVLLETRYAYLPDPKTWTGSLVKLSALPGEAPSKRRPCGACNKLGWVNGRNGPEPCERCQTRGFLLVDDYTGKSEREPRKDGPMNGSERTAWRRRVAQDIARLERMAADRARVAGDVDPNDAYPWERERARMFRHGDYAELDIARTLLRERHHSISERVEAVYVNQWSPEDNAARHGLRMVAHMLASVVDTIRVPEWLHPTEASNGYAERRAKRAS